MFEQITVAWADLSDPTTALQEIDRVLAAVMHFKRPGYIELPRDMVSMLVPRVARSTVQEVISDPTALKEALQEAVKKINAAEKPVILMGEEIYRFGLIDPAIQVGERMNIPMAVSILGKSAVPETHPLYMGVYAGALGNEMVRDYVETSDCLILLGVLPTDMNLGIFSAHLDQGKTIYVSSERIAIEHHYYEDVTARDFLWGLIKGDIHRCQSTWVKPEDSLASYPLAPGPQKITVQRLFQLLNGFIDCDMVVISDVGDALFGAIDLVTCHYAHFLSPAYYTSLGFAVPASIGVQIGQPGLRPLVLVGDGAFQMTGMELSTAVRFHLNPIVLLLNNGGYATERPMMDGPFNDVLPWNYSRLPELLGSGAGYVVETEEQLMAALASARDFTGGFSILDIKLAADDISPHLYQLTHALARNS